MRFLYRSVIEYSDRHIASNSHVGCILHVIGNYDDYDAKAEYDNHNVMHGMSCQQWMTLNLFIEGFFLLTQKYIGYVLGSVISCDEKLNDNTYNQHDQIQAVPNIKEIRHSMFLDL